MRGDEYESAQSGVPGRIGGLCRAGIRPAATLTISNDHPKPGEAVVIEVNVSPDRTTKVSWTKQGDGEFTTETQNQKLVKFVPSTPGSTVIIVCDVSTPGRQDHPSTKLVVAGAQAPAQPQTGRV